MGSTPIIRKIGGYTSINSMRSCMILFVMGSSYITRILVNKLKYILISR